MQLFKSSVPWYHDTARTTRQLSALRSAVRGSRYSCTAYLYPRYYIINFIYNLYVQVCRASHTLRCSLAVPCTGKQGHGYLIRLMNAQDGMAMPYIQLYGRTALQATAKSYRRTLRPTYHVWSTSTGSLSGSLSTLAQRRTRCAAGQFRTLIAAIHCGSISSEKRAHAARGS